MKTVLILVVGAAIGFLINHIQEYKEPARTKITSVEDAAWDRMSEQFYERCRTRYLTKTACFQHEKAGVCLERIEHKCGDAH